MQRGEDERRSSEPQLGERSAPDCSRGASRTRQTDRRDAVIAEARSWIGTPFHDCAQVKGHGVDCAQFIAAVYTATGTVPPFDIEPYSPQFMLHRSEPLFENYVRRFARELKAHQPV